MTLQVFVGRGRETASYFYPVCAAAQIASEKLKSANFVVAACFSLAGLTRAEQSKGVDVEAAFREEVLSGGSTGTRSFPTFLSELFDALAFLCWSVVPFAFVLQPETPQHSPSANVKMFFANGFLLGCAKVGSPFLLVFLPNKAHICQTLPIPLVVPAADYVNLTLFCTLKHHQPPSISGSGWKGRHEKRRLRCTSNGFCALLGERRACRAKALVAG